jgi:hypothetical protein
VLTQENGAATANFVDLATVGPSVVVPRAGDYDVQCRVTGWSTVTGGFAQIGACIGTGQPPAGLQANFNSYQAAGQGALGFVGRMAGVAAGNEIRLRYCGVNNAAGYIWRYLYVTPVRVS